jgi:signal transduction histidine kinase
MKMLLQYCVDLLKFKAESKKQDIHLQADEITLEIDREKIWRVLSNLISNAIKFSPENSIIEVEMFEKQGNVRISVTDYGSDIPDDAKDKIFDMFSGIKIRTENRDEHSFAIGLSLSKQIVEALDGKIWVKSREGQGTVFYVEFPDSMIVMQ